eukprot:1098737-Amphidinium_carterae.1
MRRDEMRRDGNHIMVVLWVRPNLVLNWRLSLESLSFGELFQQARQFPDAETLLLFCLQPIRAAYIKKFIAGMTNAYSGTICCVSHALPTLAGQDARMGPKMYRHARVIAAPVNGPSVARHLPKSLGSGTLAAASLAGFQRASWIFDVSGQNRITSRLAEG